jgi:hypothetical protein
MSMRYVFGVDGGKQQGDDAAATAMLSGVSVEVDVRSRLPLFHCHPPRHEPQVVLCSPLANEYSRHRSCLLRDPLHVTKHVTPPIHSAQTACDLARLMPRASVDLEPQHSNASSDNRGW